jgi:hypothetical protein
MTPASSLKRARGVLGLCVALLLSGCASAHYFPVPRADAIGGCQTPVPERDTLIGVALSGGGSRAALFGSAGLEALAGVRMPDGSSLLEHVNHLSSVSGGSIAASYYALKKPGRDVKVLNLDGSLSDAYRAFFDQYRAAISQDFESTLIWRQLLSFRWINSALAAKTLAEILVDRLYGWVRMEDIAVRERAGDSPGLIINTTLYNNGRRFAVSSIPPEGFDYDYFADLERSIARRGGVMESAPYIRARWKLLLPMTPIETHIDPCRLNVAGAVAGSASFPPLVGPISLRVGEEKMYWHVGDGGLYENSGVESLLFLHLRQHQLKRVKRTLIIAFDSSFPFSVGERKLSRLPLPFTLLTFDFSRIPSIMEERAGTYQVLFYRSLQLEGVIPDAKTATAIAFRHTDAKWAADLSDLPPACKAEPEPLKTVEALQERISEIPTRLVIDSECDRQLLVTAAAKLVAERKDEIIRFITRP